MTKKKLDARILPKLEKLFPERSKGSIQARLSQLCREKRVTRGAAAEIMASQKNGTVWSWLDDEDQNSLKSRNIQTITVKKSNSIKKSKEKLICYETSDPLLKKHLDEINNCYNANCPTAAFILTRKVLENLIFNMIKLRFPTKSQEDREIYLDPQNRWRFRDFSEIIKNFRAKAKSFEREEERLVLRILQLAEQFKDDANNKTHCLYHLSTKKELREADPQIILDLIIKFFQDGE